MNICERDFDSLLKWESGIHTEYKSYGNEATKKVDYNF
jgi:hypothetical protein